jgi:hypothetical protein
MRKALVRYVSPAALLLVLAGCSGFSPDAPASFAEAKKLASSEGVPLLLDFYTDW